MSVGNKNTLKVMLLDQIPSRMRQVESVLNESRDCEITVSDTLREALQRISFNPPDLIISGWQFNDLTAESLLKALKTRPEWSQIPLVLLISNKDERIVEQAIQLGVNEILIRPLDPDRLTQALDRFFPQLEVSNQEQIEVQMKKLDVNREDIRPLVKRIQNLAPLPALAHSILTIGNDPTSSAMDLRVIIEKDQSLTARILKTVNSAYYGFHRKIGNVDRAIVILGFDEIINLTLAACIIDENQGQDSSFNRRQFWKHSLGAACIARELSRNIPGLDAKDSFVIGLLHDFGKVVLDQRFQKLFTSILTLAKSAELPLYEIELEVANIDHAEIGGLVAESWKLPTPLVKAIQYHHHPEISGRVHAKEVAVAHIANYFCHQHSIGISGNPHPDEPSLGALTVLGLEDTNLDQLWNTLEIAVDSIQSIL